MTTGKGEAQKIAELMNEISFHKAKMLLNCSRQDFMSLQINVIGSHMDLRPSKDVDHHAIVPMYLHRPCVGMWGRQFLVRPSLQSDVTARCMEHIIIESNVFVGCGKGR
jgi:hypothetical protein